MIGKTSAGTSAKEERTVTAGTGQTVVTPSNGKLLSKVTINPTPSQAKIATPSAAQQTIKPDSGKLLSQVLVNAVPDSEKKGLYVWKKSAKSGKEGTLSFTWLGHQSGTGGCTIYQIASADIDLSQLTEGDFVGHITGSIQNGAIASITFKESGQADVYSPSAGSTISCTYEYDNVNYTVKIYGFYNNDYNWSDITLKSEETFLDFVVSDNASAYPDGGSQGGYWYEKVVEGADLLGAMGFTKMAVDTFTFSSRTALSIFLNHSLGEKPKFAMIMSSNTPTAASDANLALALECTNNSAYYTAIRMLNSSSKTYMAAYSVSDARTTDTIAFLGGSYGGTTYFTAGVKYTLITMA